MRRFSFMLLTLGLAASIVAALPAIAFAVPRAKVGKIAFSSDRDGNREIYVMNSDGTHATRLTNTPDLDIEPAWSPDGKKIAFASNRDGNMEIYVMKANGRGQKRLTNNNGWDDSPSWSPDGTRIAFCSYRDGNGEIYVMDADGTNQTRLTNNTWPDVDPDWSPDGSTIAFSSLGDVSFGYLPPYLILLMNPDGSNQRYLTRSFLEPLGGPDWSPDGSRIAFVDPTDRHFSSQIAIINADGTGVSAIPNPNSAVSVGSPSWSPDGSRITFTRSGDIYVWHSDGGEQQQLTNSGTDFEPMWSP